MTDSVRRVLLLVVAALVSGATALALPAAPASAAGCATGHGVTVVVDFHNHEPGGVQTACVAGGGGDTAAQLFPAAGFPLTYVRGQSFVCRVSGQPAEDPCVHTPPADAYWALYWSDGTSGRWTYATSGAGGQHVPEGGYVAFSWQGTDSSVPPGYSPAAHPSGSPSSSQAPSHAPTHGAGSGQQGQQGSSGSGTAAPSTAPGEASDAPTESPSATGAGKGAKGDKSRSAKPTSSDSPADGTVEPSPSSESTATDSPSLAPAASDPADPDDGGLPGWVAPVVILLLFGAAGAVAVVRRRQGAA
jgi:hypothetical protein